MRKLFTLLAFSAFTLISCNKDGNAPKPAATEGTIRFTNTSTNPYTIFINGSSQGSIQGKKFKEFNKTAGSYTVGALQESGYVVYPTKVEGYITIAAGEEKEFVFP